MDLPTKVWLANEIRIWGLALTAIIGVTSFIATWTHSRWSAELSTHKERVATEARQLSDRHIADANARAAEALEKAESERLERIRIELKIAPRVLSDEAKAKVALAMKEWAKLDGGAQQSVAVFAVTGSFEAAFLADQIAEALSSAGWNINRHPVTFGMGLAVNGVGLLTSSNERALSLSKHLSSSLRENGVAAAPLAVKRGGCEEQGMSKEEIAKNPWCSQISILVGDRPF